LIEIACRSNMSNSYCSGIIQTNNHAWYGTPAYHVAKLYAEQAGGQPLALGEGSPLLSVDVSAALSDDRRTLSLAAVNPGLAPVELPIDLSAFRRVRPRAEVWTIADALAAKDPEATNSFQRPERIAARASAIDGASRRFTHTLPALSATIVKLHVEE
jgi:alpha-L-arabinofuranosidase